ncbi:hypothetical protein [Frigoribacterium sp. Leaf263]|uniref:hypothetical protein n=1 Tax=Frigoribacterium sp. Leaf263 TaxID=1736313 RepID=UPI0012E2029B|nr:hypothetical protein [Frigoribacterium sp. Leaf263]
MTDIKSMHVWMIDGRSLCDRRAHPAPLVDQTDEEREATELNRRPRQRVARAFSSLAASAGRRRRSSSGISRWNRSARVSPG